MHLVAMHTSTEVHGGPCLVFRAPVVHVADSARSGHCFDVLVLTKHGPGDRKVHSHTGWV